MPTVTKVLETALYVKDPAASAGFYERVLGFQRTFEEDRLIALTVGEAGQVLLLFREGASNQPNPAPGGVIPAHDGHGRLHLAFAIPAAEEQAWKDRLAEEGVALESVVTAQYGGHSLYFRDPDGNLVELATPGVWDVY